MWPPHRNNATWLINKRRRYIVAGEIGPLIPISPAILYIRVIQDRQTLQRLGK